MIEHAAKLLPGGHCPYFKSAVSASGQKVPVCSGGSISLPDSTLPESALPEKSLMPQNDCNPPNDVARPLLKTAHAPLPFAGYNVCIFAYGQTGSGKTHTMSGTDTRHAQGRGINYRALDDLFAIRDARTGEVRADGCWRGSLDRGPRAHLRRHTETTSTVHGLTAPLATCSPVGVLGGARGAGDAGYLRWRADGTLGGLSAPGADLLKRSAELIDCPRAGAARCAPFLSHSACGCLHGLMHGLIGTCIASVGILASSPVVFLCAASTPAPQVDCRITVKLLHSGRGLQNIKDNGNS